MNRDFLFWSQQWDLLKMNTIQKLKNKINLSQFGRGVWAAAGIQGVRFLGLSLSFTYWPLYLYQERHIPMTMVGMVLLVAGAMSAVSQVVGGMLADRFGYRKMVVIGIIGETIATSALAILIGVNAEIWGVILAAILAPVMGEIITPAIQSIITEVSPKERLTESYALMTVTGNLDWAIGPAAGGYLLRFIPYGWLFGIAAFIGALSIIGVLYLPADKARKGDDRSSLAGLKSVISNRTLLVFSLLSLLFFLTMSQWGSTLSVFTVDRIGLSAEQYGILMSISGALIVLFQYPISRRMERFGARPALVLGSLLYAIGFLSLSWVRDFNPAIGSIVILVAGEMLFVPPAYALISQMSREEDRGKNLGFYGLFNTLGISIGPLLGGFLLDKYPDSPLSLWGIISLFSFTAAIGFAVWRGYARMSQPEAAGK